MNKVYIWYSSATNITGKNITDELIDKLDESQFEVSGGTSQPEVGTSDIVICYGTKTSEATHVDSPHILNHPDNIRINRNKLQALIKMSYSDIFVPDFLEINNETDYDAIDYPVIARTNYHQGGRGLAICLDPEQVMQAVNNPNINFGYMQELIPFEAEYRVHIFGGKAICAAKKVRQNDPVTSWKTNYTDSIAKRAEKAEKELDEYTLETCLNTIVKDMTLPDMLVKSNKRGWCFKKVDVENLDSTLKSSAQTAVNVLGLDFGAADCGITPDGDVYIIEVNSGPGLQGGTFNAYISAIIGYLDRCNALNPVYESNTMAQSVPSQESTRSEISELMRSVSALNDRILELSSRL